MNYYKLRININGFNIDDVKVGLEKFDSNKTKKVKVKIVAVRKEILCCEQNKTEESTREFIKYHEIAAKFDVNAESMRFYLDPNNSLFLIVELTSNLEENVYVNLDDSCESLVEVAAKSLLNIKNLESLR
jgi:hypothetical protein